MPIGNQAEFVDCYGLRDNVNMRRHSEKRKCLTVMQPWASFILDGKKRVEYRSWRTHFRGELRIHAGQKWPRAGQ
jgi:hypothetical protein